jgi:hypothetical protein
MLSGGAFRVTENVIIHLTSAVIGFSLLAIFECIQTRISYILIPSVNSLRIARIRLFFCISTVVFNSFFVLCGIMSFVYLKHPFSEISYKYLLLWDESYGGYIWHCFSALFEWLLILTLTTFYATFVPEFRNFESFNELFEMNGVIDK